LKHLLTPRTAGRARRRFIDAEFSSEELHNGVEGFFVPDLVVIAANVH
jgi:hypothetical protein